MHDTIKAENSVADNISWNWKNNDNLSFSKTSSTHVPPNYYLFGYNLPQILSVQNIPLDSFEAVNAGRTQAIKGNAYPIKVEYSDDSNDNVDMNRFSDTSVKYNPGMLLEIELNTSDPSLIPSTAVSTENNFPSIPGSSEKKISFNRNKFLPPGEPFKCNICDKECPDRIALESHLSVHGQRCKIRKCDYCDQTFSSKGKWYTHFKTHFSDPSFDCMFCNSTFVTENYLQEHLKIHTPEQISTCNIEMYQSEERKYPCTFCGKEFPDRSGILFHLRIHTSDIIFRCMYCGKMFLNKSELNLHVRVHTGEKTHVCELCHKTFLTTSNLKQHLRTHTGDKPYCCTTCDKTFSNKSNLMQHTKVHTGEKPYKCKFCEKSFTTTSNLTQHLRIHTGVKPYVCAMCGKAFINNSNLSQHKKVHGIDPKKNATDKT